KNPLLSLPHRRRGATVTFRMIVSKHVKRSVDNQARQFFARGNTECFCVSLSNRRANVNVADYRHLSTFPRQSESDDVCRTIARKKLFIELSHHLASHERHRNKCVLHALGCESSNYHLP